MKENWLEYVALITTAIVVVSNIVRALAGVNTTTPDSMILVGLAVLCQYLLLWIYCRCVATNGVGQ